MGNTFKFTKTALKAHDAKYKAHRSTGRACRCACCTGYCDVCDAVLEAGIVKNCTIADVPSNLSGMFGSAVL